MRCILTWYHIGVLLFLTILSMYTCSQKQGTLYTPAELWGGLWILSLSLEFFKICPIFLDDLKIVRILCLFNILPIRSVPYGKMDPFVWCQRPLSCLHVYWLFWLCLFCRVRFSVRLVLSDWVWCSLSEMVKALCISELIADCFRGDVTRQVLSLLKFVHKIGCYRRSGC